MYGEDYLDNLFTAVYYTPNGDHALYKNPDNALKQPQKNNVRRPASSSGSGRRNQSGGTSKFVAKIRQQSKQGNPVTSINRINNKRPVSAPAKKKRSKAFEPKVKSKIGSYDSYAKRRQAEYAHTEPVKRMDSSEYPMFPVLAETQPVNESPSKVTYSEPESNVVANESSYFVDTANTESFVSEKPSVASNVQKYSNRPYDLDKQYTDLNEWIGLRQNYIHQIESLERYERMCGSSQVLSEISMPNFYALLLAIRKISMRIADNYKMIVLQKETPLNLLEVHSYVVSMVTDMNCLDRQPFIDWTGLHFIFNPFVSAYRCDGTISTAMADMNVKSNRKEEQSPSMIPKELVMDQYENAECRELGAVLWGAYEEDNRKRRQQAEQDEAIKEQLAQTALRKAELAMKKEAFEFSGPKAVDDRCRKRAWVAWKKAFHLEISIKSMESVRKHIIKRNVRSQKQSICFCLVV